MGVTARQYFSRPGQSVLGDDLMADAMPADVVEAPDAEVGDEFPGMLTADRISDRRCRHGVVHHHRQFLRVVNPVGLYPFSRELEVDQHGHVDIDDDGVTGRYGVLAGLAGEDLLEDGHAHAQASVGAYLASMSDHSAKPTRLKNSVGVPARWVLGSVPLSSHSAASMAAVARRAS